MKRKLPQWLLDATNGDRSNKISQSTQNCSNSVTESRNADYNNENIEPNQNDSIPNPAESDQIRNNGTIKIVPLANLLSPSRGGIQTSDSNKDVHISAVISTTQSTSNSEIPTTELHSVNGINDEPSTSNSNESSANAVIIKTEVKQEPTDSSATVSDPAQGSLQNEIKKEIKKEPENTSNTPATTATLNTVNNAAVTTQRESCNYGIKCFRRNPGHRTSMAHPGDLDYRRPNLPNAPPNAPPCPWGAACYRRNPQHFIQLSHPPATNATSVNANPIPRQPRNRQNNRRVVTNIDLDEEDDYDLEDPFIDDGSSDEYVPDESDDTDDDLEDTQEESLNLPDN